MVFSDGPRWINHKNKPDKRDLTTSLTTTWTEPQYRGYGLYQYAIQFYMKTLGVHRTTLYTENEETLEFIYRARKILGDASLRAELLNVPGMKEYFQKLEVNEDLYLKGKKDGLLAAEKALMFLSLQGRTRLNMGLSFDVEKQDAATIRSAPIDPEKTLTVKSAIKSLEATILETLKESPEKVRILPKAYLQKFKADLQKSCEAALTNQAS
jgi:hypothetical protein